MASVTLTKQELENSLKFMSNYPTSWGVTIDTDSSSGIGYTVKVSIDSMINGEMVTITKTISDSSSW